MQVRAGRGTVGSVLVRLDGGPEPAAPSTSLCLLGTFQLDVAGQRVTLPIHAQRVLAFVALNNVVSRSLAAGTLWPDVREELALGSLRSAIWRVQRACPGVLSVSRHVMSLEAGVHVDVGLLLQGARELSQTSDEAVVQASIRTAALGELLAGWYDDWVLLERERLRQVRLHALEDQAATLLDRGRYAAALDAAWAAVKAEPMRESAHRLVIRVHIAEGNSGEAMRQFLAYRELLAEELGLQPSAQILSLVRNLQLNGSVRRRSVATGR